MAAGYHMGFYKEEAIITRDIKKLEQISRNIRTQILLMAKEKRIHLGPAFSIVDILVSLYCSEMNPLFDKLILSKGHGVMALYATLSEVGILDKKVIEKFNAADNILAGHPTLGVPGIDAATGSLGHGLSIACGMALAVKKVKKNATIFVILGDGELNEGSVWEAAMFASHKGLHNLVAIVDKNKYQQSGRTEDVINLHPLDEKWKSFGWNTVEVDGHSYKDLLHALGRSKNEMSKPTMIIANTIKGKGISFMENKSEWHMGILDNEQLLSSAINDI